jgi:hypothetical protein
MKEKGNTKSNAYFNPNEVKHPPPTNMIEQERDSDLEKYIRGTDLRVHRITDGSYTNLRQASTSS